MTTKNFSILSLIGVFGVGLFMIFLNIFSAQLSLPKSPITVSNNTSSVSSKSSSSFSSSTSNTISSQAAISSAQPVVATTTYKDGTYSASANYDYANITVTLAVKNDTITSVQNSTSGDRGQSATYSSRFKSAITGQVVGKNLASINLNSVSGASYTTQGFMDALNQIQTQAKN
ncbi:MAG: FMN-binding protein [bacterium]